MVEQLPVSKEICEMALEHARNRLKFEFDRFALPDAQRVSMITMGSVGQLLFKEWLEKQETDFEFQFQFGKYDDFDFMLKGAIVELKTSGFSQEGSWRNLNAIYNASQLRQALKKGFYCSVQVFVNGYNRDEKYFDSAQCDTGVIAGWVEIADIVKKKPVSLPYGEAYLIPISELKPISALIER